MTAWRFPTALVSLTLAALTIGPLAAADTRTEAIIGGTLIHNVRTTWAGRSAEQRAAQVQQRLNVALAQGPIHPKDITVGQVQGDWCVLFRGKRFLTADPMTAQQDHSPAKALANKWAAHLRQVLPELTRNKGK